jgi:hypothetical protein
MTPRLRADGLTQRGSAFLDRFANEELLLVISNAMLFVRT